MRLPQQRTVRVLDPSSLGFVSLFHHEHGTSIAIINEDPTEYWKREDGYDPTNDYEYLERFDLPPAYAVAPKLLAACQLLIELEDNDVHPADTRWKTARQLMRAAVEYATPEAKHDD